MSCILTMGLFLLPLVSGRLKGGCSTRPALPCKTHPAWDLVGLTLLVAGVVVGADPAWRFWPERCKDGQAETGTGQSKSTWVS
jgi:hypothetical protein